jgi:hypothetical protein
MESLNISVKQFRIFRPDTLPFPLLRTGSGVEALKTMLRFREAIIDPASSDIAFNGGDVQDGTRFIVVNSLQVNPQRMILDVAADSASANLAFQAVAAVFAQLGRAFGGVEAQEPLVFTEETTCVARLAFQWTELLSDKFADFVSANVLPQASTPNGDASVSGLQLRLLIKYDAKNAALHDYNVFLGNKALVVEPRENLPLSERIYFTSSPLSSDEHLRLLEELEGSLAGDRLPARRRS